MKKKAVVKKKKVSVKKTAPKKAVMKPIGVVTHFYTAIKVAIIKFKKPVKVGSTIALRGATTDFNQKIISMQYDHKPVLVAKKGQEIGLKVGKRVREGDEVFEI
jgi:putative protease